MHWLLLNSRQLLLIAVLTGLGIFAFYREENWRGARAWNETQTRLRAHGETVDWAALLPPPVAESQNLGAIALFRTAPDPKTGKALEPLALNRALQNISSDDYHLPTVGKWTLGKTADMDAVQKDISSRYQKIFSPAPNAPRPAPLAELDALCPALDDLRRAAATRPLCRFDRDYTSQPAFNRSLGPVTKLISLGQALNLHALLALHAQEPDMALDDIETVLTIDSGVRQEPILVSGLVAIGVMAIQTGSLWEGLTLHAWNDAQLAQLQGDLKKVDFLPDLQLCLRGEAVGNLAPMMDYLRNNRLSASKMLLNLRAVSEENPPSPVQWLFWAAPSGWFDLGKNLGVTLLYQAADEAVDPVSRRVFPQKADPLEQEVKGINPYAPWNFFPRISLPPVIFSTSTFAFAQFRVETARIACMLERYRLAQGAYPDSLESLRIYDPDGVPHDLIGGAPLHYQRQGDGYLLYSIGWNQTDEGGKPAYKPDSPQALDNRHGDWVWPSPVEKQSR